MADFENIEPDEYKYLGCNYNSGRPQGIHGITIHHMAGNLSADDCNRVWANTETSAHYSIDQNGYIVQHINDGDRAWACGNAYANDTTISIEHANNNSNPWTVFPAAIESGAHLVAALCKAYGLGRPEWMVNVFPHSHWSSTACPGELAGSQNAEYMQRAQEWYDAMCNGTEASPAPQPSAPAETPAYSGDFHVHMQAESYGTVLEPVCDNNDNAGIDSAMTYLAAWGDGFDLVVQANDLPALTNPSNIYDHENGAVGDGGPIYKLRMYSYFPKGDKRIWYRVMTQNSAPNWLPWMKDDIDTGGSGDNFAGDNSPIMRVESFIGDL